MYISFLSVFLWFACFAPYILSIYKWETKPHTISRWIWALTTWLWFVIQVSEGVWYWSLTLWFFSLVSTWIFLYSLKKGESRIEKMEIFSLILSLIAIAFRLYIWEWIVAVILISIADSLWFIPTYHKANIDPNSESLLYWILNSASLWLSFLSMDVYVFEGIFFSAVMLTCEIVLIWIILYRRNNRSPLSSRPNVENIT